MPYIAAGKGVLLVGAFILYIITHYSYSFEANAAIRHGNHNRYSQYTSYSASILGFIESSSLCEYFCSCSTHGRFTANTRSMSSTNG